MHAERAPASRRAGVRGPILVSIIAVTLAACAAAPPRSADPTRSASPIPSSPPVASPTPLPTATPATAPAARDLDFDALPQLDASLRGAAISAIAGGPLGVE